MQETLGSLDDDTRRIRAHIGSLVLCEPGIPVTIDDLLGAIGRGRFAAPPLHDGCWCCGMWWECDGTQHGQPEAMAAIERILTGYLEGGNPEESIERFPDAEGFVRRAYGWLPPVGELSRIQRLMIERMLLPFEFFAGRNTDYATASRNCFEEGGRGAELDGEISKLAGLPAILADYKGEFHENLRAIDDPRKKDLYRICGAIAHSLHGLSDCHHSAFRWIERWVHDVATLSVGIPERPAGSERRRLARALFGYALGLDKWLLGKSMQFLLMDLAYADIGIMAVVASPDCVNVHQLFLLPQHQGKDIGRECMLLIIEEARRLGRPIRLRVMKVNPRAGAFFQRRGFVRTGETDTHVLMERVS